MHLFWDLWGLFNITKIAKFIHFAWKSRHCPGASVEKRKYMLAVVLF